MNDSSRLSLQELIALYEEMERTGDNSAELEALEAEVQRRMDLVRKMWGDFTEKFNKIFERVYQTAVNLLNAISAPFLIEQYEKEIKRVEQLLKYTKHSKKRQQHEKNLKWLRKQLAGLKETK
jgi:uncharacterized protein YukE